MIQNFFTNILESPITLCALVYCDSLLKTSMLLIFPLEENAAICVAKYISIDVNYIISIIQFEIQDLHFHKFC